MKLCIIILLATSASASAADFAGFVRAVHQVETSGRTTGHIIGDGGKSLGPLQVSRAAWQDSRVGGRYEDVADLAVATRVLRAYLTRYAPKALAAGESAGNWQECSRIWNGGPKGASKTATLAYWRKVEAKL